MRRYSQEKRRRRLLACYQLPSPPRRQLHVGVWVRPHLLPSGLGARQRDPDIHLSCPSPRNPRPSRSKRHGRQRQHLLLPPLSKQLKPLKQRRLIQVQLHYLQQQQFWSLHPEQPDTTPGVGRGPYWHTQRESSSRHAARFFRSFSSAGTDSLCSSPSDLFFAFCKRGEVHELEPLSNFFFKKVQQGS